MKKIFLCFSFIGALTLPANASVSANVSFATDYIWRGMTQTGEEPAISGGHHLLLVLHLSESFLSRYNL